jgi:hypothetical protein
MISKNQGETEVSVPLGAMGSRSGTVVSVMELSSILRTAKGSAWPDIHLREQRRATVHED